MTELNLIKGKPKIFTISSDSETISLLKDFIEDYEYEFSGSANKKEDIFRQMDEISPNLVFFGY